MGCSDSEGERRGGEKLIDSKLSLYGTEEPP